MIVFSHNYHILKKIAIFSKLLLFLPFTEWCGNNMQVSFFIDLCIEILNEEVIIINMISNTEIFTVYYVYLLIFKEIFSITKSIIQFFK